ncbi:TPA: DUF1642 domain-containing protein [Streptococcus suis]|uniref:DUF1642 domain-containing protein n=1 Tax=Streptococcus suis TaxID=1307 RepID=UPI003708B152
MNKQEAIKRVEELYGYGSRAKTVTDIISQIHEPQKVVVPKFVAEWIEECKNKKCILYFAMVPNTLPKAVNEWLTYDGNADIFARAWFFGYEIKQEQLYTVEIPNNGGTLILACINHAIKLVDGNKHLPGKFTKESIEYAGFDWALKWAKPAEAE